MVWAHNLLNFYVYFQISAIIHPWFYSISIIKQLHIENINHRFEIKSKSQSHHEQETQEFILGKPKLGKNLATLSLEEVQQVQS